MKTCSFPGCGRSFYAQGLCKTHYAQRRERGDGRLTPINEVGLTAEQKFWRRVTKSPGCWEWAGARKARGYGIFFPTSGRRHKAIMMVHRFSWVLHNGPIPPGMYVCHRCDNPPCVRPDHLFLGTHADNTLDMIGKGRHVRSGRRSAVLRADDVRAIRARAGSASIAALAREFGISESQVSRIIKGLRWTHLV